MHCTKEDLRAFAERIQKSWGAHLYVRVVPTRTPAMEWRTVQVPAECIDWTPATLLEILLHEWGHRTLSPLSPARMHLWRKIAMTAGLTESQEQMVGNIAADAWVDSAYLRSSDWGAAYTEGMLDEVEMLAAQGDANEGGASGAFRRIYRSFHSRLIRDVGVGPAPAPGHAILADPASPEERAVAEGVWKIVYDDARDEETRIRDLARLLKPHLPPEITVRLRVSLSLTGAEPGGRSDPGPLLELADRFGVAAVDVAPHLNAEAVRKLRLRAKRLALYARVVPTVKAFLGKRERMRFAGYKSWRNGRPLRELDVLATMKRSALVIRT